ncbi:MAG: hypothetical protein CM15mP127_03480 [Gammaproteobacteria bacterium]|nr:MAG: hypothetical protein CM15mP127_03480 [Gammaproteobacteria bacterium]
MKNFLGAFLTFCIGAIAQEYKYEPVSNKAEYYISKFKGFRVMLIIDNGAWMQLR